VALVALKNPFGFSGSPLNRRSAFKLVRTGKFHIETVNRGGAARLFYEG
jgi:hypothetical protein